MPRIADVATEEPPVHEDATGVGQPSSVRLAVVTDDERRHEWIDRVSPWDVADVTPDTVLGWVDDTPDPVPTVIVLDGIDQPEVALRLGATVDQRHRHVVAVLMAEGTPDIFAAALRTGVRDLIAPEAGDADVAEILERAVAAALVRAPSPGETPVGGGHSGRVITVTSPKGGSGKTTVTTNLAVDLGARFPSEVVVVDLDLQFGDVASCLRLEPDHTVVDAVAAVTGDDVVLKSFLTDHPSGCYALCAPESPAEGEQISAGEIGALIDRLAASFRFVLIDTAPGLLEATLVALERSDDVVLLAGMDVPSIRGLHRELVVLDELGLVQRRRHIVVNFVDRRAGLTVDDVAAMLGAAVDVQLPRSRVVPLSTNRGVPLLHEQARGPVVRGLRGLVDELAGVASATRQRGARRRPRQGEAT